MSFTRVVVSTKEGCKVVIVFGKENKSWKVGYQVENYPELVLKTFRKECSAYNFFAEVIGGFILDDYLVVSKETIE